MTWPDGARFEGGFCEGKPHGQGRGALVLPDGGRFEGGILGGQPHGRGVQVKRDGRRFEGTFHEGAAASGTWTMPAKARAT